MGTENELLAQLSWMSEFRAKFTGGIAHTFVFHGAIDDYVGHVDGAPITAVQLFERGISARTVVCRYNYSRGLTFAQPIMRGRFFAALGETPQTEQEGERLFPRPDEAFAAIERVILSADPNVTVAVIIEDAELIWPDGEYTHLGERDRTLLATMRRWAKSPEFTERAPIVSLWTQSASDLHASLRVASSTIEQILLPYPSTAERTQFIVERLEARSDYVLAEGLTPEGFGNLTGGLSRVLIDDVCLRAKVEDRPIDRDLVKARKDQIIRDEFGDLIEILEPRHGFEAVGGMTEVKQYLQASVIAPLRNPAIRSRMPAGVMLAGPPGTGKTHIVSALAREAGVSVVKLNAGRLLGQYVGNSERNLERALACIRSLVPTVVMIDEIEQQFQRGGVEGSGVERRIFGRILEEMSGAGGTQRGDVVWFAATNRIDLVDAALRRPGRFDRIVPILPPSPDERWEILKSKLHDVTVSEAERSEILRLTEQYTGADVDGLLIKAAELAFDAGRSQVATDDLIVALSLLRPSHDAEATEQMINVALEYCNDLSLVPDAWRDRLA